MNQFGRVVAYLSSPYWCVYCAQCMVRKITWLRITGFLFMGPS